MNHQELRALLADMSLKEKIGQLTQLDASFFSHEGPVTGPASELGIDEEDAFLCGSILGAVGSERTAQLQRMCMAKQPHGIPLLLMADIINGFKTIFPIPLALGCTYDPDALRTVGDIMARESAATGLHVTFAPMVDLVRDARWGRVMESTGEDPWLNSLMAEAMVRGIQGGAETARASELKLDKKHIGACTKHFAAYGAPVAGKEYNNVELSMRSLLEDYLPAYQAAISAGSSMIMTSFNTIDRIPVTANKWLLRTILREQMGFDGVLISDWNAIGELIEHGVAANSREAALLAIEAGVDMDMMSGCYMRSLTELVEDGSVPVALIDEAVWRILVLKNSLNLFEDPFGIAGKQSEAELLLNDKHKQLARKIAADSFVLLKNDKQALPLKNQEQVAWIGPYTDEKNTLGAWSFFGEKQYTTTIREALEERGLKPDIAAGCGILNPGQTVYGFRYSTKNEMTADQTQELINQAVQVASGKDKVVLALGEVNIQTGEGGSRADITIPAVQQRLFDAIYAVNQNIITLIFAGRPLDIRSINEQSQAVLYVWMPGTEAGCAIVDVLYGDVNPQGRLSMSLPYSVGQVPVYYSELRTGRHTEDGSEPGNRFLTKYADIPNNPLYPFGYGLSYTDFSISPISLSSDKLTSEGSITAAVTIKNTGKSSGIATVQLYITDELANVARPLRELKGIRKIRLESGQEERVTYTIDSNMLRFYDINMKHQTQQGWFTVWIGDNSQTRNSARFELI
jgi:beta-glucosidase